MRQYLYPKNLRSAAKLWLWSLRDFGVLFILLLLSVVLLVCTHSVVPLALALAYGFLTIRPDSTTVMDFLRWAVEFFLTSQQTFFWR